ncbi:hypothetical protein TRFO_37266 [Tritrichomonas foetus]|uniref:Guanylate cyclase domain-containing protein n=1 Tax=Tritrichomonas foetus TaxID=1144522 RepID=A0A1J4JBJ9_9EUKA|nr:hypothetical protein TRFO_37266 [Tritrichomonas foetus]|eukprot:OHS96558.1 hypothetical protein TRFO_37266 [Tritrichomonas foetus]
MYPSYLKFWDNVKYSNVTYLFGFFARFIPAKYSDQSVHVAVYSILFVLVLLSIIILWCFMSYPNLLFRKTHPSIVFFVIPVGIIKLFVIPSIALFCAECVIYYGNPTTMEFVLSVLNIIISILYSYLFELINNVVPSFSFAGNLTWNTRDFIIQQFYYFIIALPAEFMNVLGIKCIRIIFFSVLIVVHLFAINYYIFFDKSLSFSLSLFHDLVHGALFISNILFIVNEFISFGSSSFLQFFIVMVASALPLEFIVRTLFLNFIQKTAKKFLDSIHEKNETENNENPETLIKFKSPNYEQFAKYNARYAMSVVSVLFPNKQFEWDMLKTIISLYFPTNFEFHFLSARFQILNPSNLPGLIHSYQNMKKFQGLNFVYRLQTALVQQIIIQIDVRNELSKITNNKYTKGVVNHYFLSLKMFWTEVLLSKTDYLMSLSVNANNAFLELIQYYTQNLIDVDQIRQLNTICGISKSRLIKEKETTLLQTIAEDKVYNTSAIYDLIRETEKQIPNISREILEKKSSIANIFLWQHLAFYLSFYFSFLAVLVFAGILVYSNRFDSYFQLFHTTTELLNYYSNTDCLIPYVVLAELGLVNITSISRYILNNDLYQTKLMNPRDDMKYCAERSYFVLDNLKSVLKLISNKTLFSSKNFIGSVLGINGQVLRTEMSFISFMELSEVQKYNLMNNSLSEYEKMLQGNDVLVSYQSNSQLIHYIVDTLLNITEWAPIFLENEALSVINITMNCLSIVAIFFFVLTVISSILLIRCYNRFFNLLISIPKINISSLISKLGISLPHSNQYDFKIRYDLTMLSYESPLSSYKSTNEALIYLILFNFLILFLTIICLLPMKENYLKDIRKCFYSLKEMKLKASLVPKLYSILNSLCLTVYLKKVGQTNSSNYEYFLNILKKETDMSYSELTPYITQLDKIPIALGNYFQNKKTDGYSIQNSFQLMIIKLYCYYQTELLNITVNEEEIIGNVLRFISNVIPELSQVTFREMKDMISVNSKSEIFRVYTFLLCQFAVFCLVDAFLCPLKNSKDFVTSLLSSVPVNITSLTEPDYEDTLAKTKGFLNSGDIFPKVKKYIFLVDFDGIIFKITEDAMIFFSIEQNELTIDELVDRIEKYPQDHTFPPPDGQPVFIDCRVPSKNSEIGQDVFLSMNFIDTQIDGASYAVVLDDISTVQTQITLLNEEANRVRVLMAQLVPWEIATTILTSDGLDLQVLPKIAVCSFFIEANFEENKKIHEILKSMLAEYKGLTYMGRSITLFRIVSSLFDQKIKIPYSTDLLVRFSLEFVEYIKNLATETGSKLQVRCAINIDGPFFSSIISDTPPFFNICGQEKDISLIICMNCMPNQVNISRKVYEAVFDLGYQILFENEIYSEGGEIIQAYSIHPLYSDPNSI